MKSEESFRLAAQSEAITLYEQDADLRYTWLCPLHPQQAGALGRTDLDILGEQWGHSLTEWKHEILKTGEPGRREFSAQLQDGLHFYDVFISPRTTPDGRITGVAGAALDITDRKLAEEKLREQYARLELLSDALARLLASHEPHQIVADLFPRLAQLLNLQVYFCHAANQAGDALDLLSHAGADDEAASAMRRLKFGEGICGSAAVTREPLIGSHQGADENSAAARALGLRSWAAHPLLSGGHLLGVLTFASKDRENFSPGELEFMRAICGYVAIALERKRWELALAQSRTDLEKKISERTAALTEVNGQLEALVYSIAHDLRAPLRSMQGFASMLLDEYAPRLDSSAEEYARRIVRSAERMDALVIDLLAYGRVTRAEMPLTPVSSRIVWQAALVQNEQLVRERNAEIATGEFLPEVLAHEGALVQIFANLLNNALKFVPSGKTPKIRFWCEETKSNVYRFWVEDNGIGIAGEYHDRIFRVFERLNARDYSGTGIGLSIVRKGIERMGGAAGVESEPEKGSRFWIELAGAPLGGARENMLSEGACPAAQM